MTPTVTNSQRELTQDRGITQEASELEKIRKMWRMCIQKVNAAGQVEIFT
jgi:hypothetical protein